jgi:hypothetical protein
MLEEKGFTEDNKYTDMKILVAFIACCLGALSHFYPIPFPQNKFLLIGCVVGYVICATAYYLIERRFEGDAFYLAGGHKINALKEYQKVKFSSDLDTSKKQEAYYVIKVTATSSSKSKTIEVEKRFDVTTFYDENGYLHRYKVKERLEEVIQKLISSPR